MADYPPKPRKVPASTLNRCVLLLFDFCEQLRRQGCPNTANEVGAIAREISASPEIENAPILVMPQTDTVH